VKKKKKKRDLAQDVSNWVDIFWRDRVDHDGVWEIDAHSETEEEIRRDLRLYDDHQRNEIEAWDLWPRGVE
jgi:hypothetical protein